MNVSQGQFVIEPPPAHMNQRHSESTLSYDLISIIKCNIFVNDVIKCLLHVARGYDDHKCLHL